MSTRLQIFEVMGRAKGGNNRRGREILSKNLKVERAVRDLSQEGLADLCDLSRNLIGKIERREVSATIDRLEDLADGLDLPMARLLEDGRK